ncbi:venom serine carboxypeptidase-like [Cydia pomonella]|uniref:venom serine carboxypeptidase-like n=1 Tax=Cydia pomonella TaxID=82600 RepID=UPI002ADDB1A2|nr:venom serine carboxypeptidase-like [Cydia pomonella]
MIIRTGIVVLCVSITLAANAPMNTTPALMLSPFIKQNRLQEARNASLVNSTLFLNITSYAGFLTVDSSSNSNMFFWYFPVAGKPVNETPWIIWLQGGPGASSLAGLFDEIGPFEYDGAQLKRRQWSWGNNYSLLFVDNPVGAGFSFTDKQDGFVKDMETCSKNLYNALQQFLTVFPELRTAPMYIAGESYAGRYVPAFGYKILEEQPTGNASINFKGLTMGNPIIDRIDAANISSVYYHWGLLDTQGLLAVKPLQDKYSQAVEQNNLHEAWNLRDQLNDLLIDISQQPNHFNLLNESGNLRAFTDFIDQPHIKEALHVGTIQFTFNNGSVDDALMKDFLGPIRPKLEKLLEHYKIMVYCGQLDLTAPCELAADSRRKHWHWSHRDDFLKAPRRPWTLNGTLAGYVKEGGGLTEVLVRGVGHLVPLDAPAASYALLQHFIQDYDLPLPSDFRDKPEYTPLYVDNQPTDQPAPKNNALIASVVLNVLLIVCLISGVVVYMRFKRRSEAFFYSTVEDSISDGILTMT